MKKQKFRKKNIREISILGRFRTPEPKEEDLEDMNTPKFALHKHDSSKKHTQKNSFPIPSQFDYENKLKPRPINQGAGSNYSGKSDYQAGSEWSNTTNLNKKVGRYTQK